MFYPGIFILTMSLVKSLSYLASVTKLSPPKSKDHGLLMATMCCLNDVLECKYPVKLIVITCISLLTVLTVLFIFVDPPSFPLPQDVLQIGITTARPPLANETLSYFIGNPICKVLFPSSIQFFQHHKTGTVLARSLLHIISEFCNITDEDPNRVELWGQLRWLNFRDSPQSLIRLQGDLSNNIRIHFWRDPVLTIVSGFTYHLSSKELWTSSEFSVRKFESLTQVFGSPNTDFRRLYEKYKNLTWTYDVNREPPIWRSQLTPKQLKGK